jgi:hypothetical protein
VRRRWREIAFALTYFIAAVFPALFLTSHTFFLHTYVPIFGVLYLVARLVEDLLALRRFRSNAVRMGVLGAVLVAMGTVSFVMVRKNERYKLLEVLNLPRSFVLRRSMIARNLYNGIESNKPFDDNVKKVYLVYGREEGRDRAKWNNENVKAATGWGSMLPLVYDNPDLEVEFKVVGDSVHEEDLIDADMFLYDDYGSCYDPKLERRD